jgi:glutaminase
MSTNPVAAAPYVSTGQLPPSERVGLLVNEAYQRFRDNGDGELSQVYPSLATVDPDRFGICVANTKGLTAIAGDADVEFSIMSVAKPFVFALMCTAHSPNAVAQCRSRRADLRRGWLRLR